MAKSKLFCQTQTCPQPDYRLSQIADYCKTDYSYVGSIIHGDRLMKKHVLVLALGVLHKSKQRIDFKAFKYKNLTNGSVLQTLSSRWMCTVLQKNYVLIKTHFLCMS